MGARYRQQGAKGGSWYYRFWLHGKLWERGGFSTKRAAMDAEFEKRREIGDSGGSRSPSFSRVVQDYLATKPVSPVTLKSVKPVLEAMESKFGFKPIDRVNAQDVQSYKTHLLRDHKGATANRHLAYLSAVFSWAQERELVPQGYNPASALKVKREAEPWRPWIILTDAQLNQLWSLLPERERVKVELLFYLGVRKGVVLGLTWDRVDWQNDLITYRSKGKDGVIPMNKPIRKLLETLHTDQGNPLVGPVFPKPAMITLRRQWKKAKEAIGQPKLRMHDLRVTFARKLASKGVDLKTIQGLLGHATIAMTTRYIPADLSAKREAVHKLEELG